MLSNALSILSSQAGSFIYNLIVLLVLDAGLVIALGQWRRGRDAYPYAVTNRARVQAVALIGMLGLRGLLVVAALIARGSPETTVVWIPPLERAIDVVSLGLLAWAFVPVLRDRVTHGLGLVVINTVAAGVFYIILTAIWNGQVTPGQAWVWAIWGIGIAIAAMALLTRDLAEEVPRSPEQSLSLVAFGILLLGYGLHLLTLGGLLPPYSFPNVTTWTRLGQLVAYPLFVLAIYQGTIATLSSKSEELQGLSKTSMEQIKGLVSLFEASRRISQSLDLSEVLEDSGRWADHATSPGRYSQSDPPGTRRSGCLSPQRTAGHKTRAAPRAPGCA
jgi:hypothetical protein